MLALPQTSSGRLRVFLSAILLAFIACLLLLTARPPAIIRNITRPSPKHQPRPPLGSPYNPDAEVVACRGPGGSLLDVRGNRRLTRMVYDLPNITYPHATTGSYTAIGLEKSWMTFDDRYGPYGYGEDSEDYEFGRVDWDEVNWGMLQYECLAANKARFGDVGAFNTNPRFGYQKSVDVARPPSSKTGRQAVVLRSWSTYKYHEEDMWNIRSIIAEASLASGGEYDVILLVDVKDEEKGALIHQDDEVYREVLEASVPLEFRDIAVLFDYRLQENWYPKVNEYRPIWQIMQPLQLFAHFYPEYDHYWQFELDTRFTGDVGKMLQAFHDFSKKEPYKQARERASWAYFPAIHGSYEEFIASVNESLDGGATVWGPVAAKGIDPLVSALPVKDPKDDDFGIGVGWDADLLLMGPLNKVNWIETEDDWVFKSWHPGFDKDQERYLSVPAQARASWDLLESVHRVQHELGYRIPSESTLPSFALWNGLKVVGLPVPNFQFPERNMWELNYVLNGGLPRDFDDGIAHGPGRYRSSRFAFFQRPFTWAWWSSLCDPIFDHWMYGEHKLEESKEWPPNPRMVQVPEELPFFMAKVDGKVYAPAFIMHPRKTNHYVS